MNIELPWGDEKLSVNVPDTWNVIFPEPNGSGEKKKSQNELTIVRNAMKKPADAKSLSSMKLRGKKIVIVVDDNTRPTPAHRFFHIVLDELKKAGASMKNVLVIPALGIHTPMTEEEMAAKIGAKNLKAVSWENHNAFNKDTHHAFGTTSRGTPVMLNSRVKEADLVVSVGIIEPHLWAGFGGGMKNILPGVASSETISVHHEIIAEPPYLFNRVGMLPRDNSFRLDLEEIQGMIDADIFCVNVSLDGEGSITGCFAGDPVAAHRAGVEFNFNRVGVNIDHQVDGIIVNSHPMDINLKQSMKCVGNSLPALKPGGAVLGFLRAQRGIDDISLPEEAKPLWLVRTILRLIGPSRVRGFLDKVRKGLNVEEKFLIYYSMQLIRAYNLYLYVPTVTEEESKLLGYYTRCVEPQEVIDNGVKKLGKKATVAVFPEGGVTFPIVG